MSSKPAPVWAVNGPGCHGVGAQTGSGDRSAVALAVAPGMSLGREEPTGPGAGL